MTMMPGVRLGAYEIVSAIGAGGMGDVYKARDTNLDRDVAIPRTSEVRSVKSEVGSSTRSQTSDFRQLQTSNFQTAITSNCS
jgi:serine/threonine protein kinase